MYYKTLVTLKPIDDHKCVIVSSRNNRLEGNLHFIYRELLSEFEGVKIHFVYTKNKMNLNLFKEIFLFSDAKYLILDDYFLSIYLIKPKKNMKIIQLWHAAGALKKFGHSTIGTRFGPNRNYLKVIPIHSNYTHVYVSSQNIVPYYAEAFNMSEDNIYPLGIPRTDLFFKENEKNEIISSLYNDYPELKKCSKVKILIAPTYRAKGPYKESEIDFIKILKDISRKINNNVKILFKPHPYVETHQLDELRNLTNIFLVDNKYFINEWMLISDAFITDYSSSVFEFSLLHKPICHFVPDIKEYTKNRGFYQQLEEVSDGKIIENKEELIQWINERVKGECFDTSRMVDYNFDKLENVSKIIVNHFVD